MRALNKDVSEHEMWQLRRVGGNNQTVSREAADGKEGVGEIRRCKEWSIWSF